MNNGRSGFDSVERALRRRTFATVSTLTERGHPHATGVVYALSPPGTPFALYITTRTTTRKVRNIRARPEVAVVVPVPHRFVPVFPPRCVQFLGMATVLDGDDAAAIQAFDSSWFLRRILATEHRIVAQGDGDLCFLRIGPGSTVFTYGMHTSLLANLRRPRGAIGRVAVPPDRM